MDKTKISKKMSYMLRHCADPLYINLNGVWLTDYVPPEFFTIEYSNIEN